MEILIVLLSVVLVYLIGLWILGPIDRAASAAKCPMRYRIVDCFCLMVELQVVFGTVFALKEFNPRVRMVLGGVVALIVVVMWYKGVSTLSHAGIEHPGRRAAFNWYVLPFTYVGALALVPVTIVFTAELTDVGPARVHPALWVAAIACPLGLLIGKRASNWIIRGTARPVASAE
jgi:hypothetical protein